MTPPTDEVRGPGWARLLRRCTVYLSQDFGGGPRPWRLAWVVNFQKGATFPALAALMLWYDNFSIPACIYLALHGSYGLMWLLKDLAFPDPAWQVRVTLGGGLNAFLLVLGPYWLFGWLLISRTAQFDYPLPEPLWYCLCITLCLCGTALMIAADAQKFFTLRLRNGLISDGVFRWIRHPNYLGEMMVYGGFALLVWHWLPFVLLAFVWIGVFAVNMVLKEARLSRHPGWPEYRRRSWWLVPWVF